jgi:bifunctional non-homologous end joining protein LigD
VRKTAFVLKEILDQRDLPSFIKTTGSRGVHIHIPLQPDKKFEEVKAAARTLAEALHDDCEDLTTLEQRKNKRDDKVFIDYLRNDYGMSVTAPYSLRTLKYAPVATPIDWEELKETKLGPQSYMLKNIFRRLQHKVHLLLEESWS